eukprot:GHVL01015043.1.p1 GENE.GHVL01015043.1~~GHVL01015043.1.p1  ORF type:complete len:891 (-),score=214.83 GHVL01015043.1:298-2970(-)
MGKSRDSSSENDRRDPRKTYQRNRGDLKRRNDRERNDRGRRDRERSDRGDRGDRDKNDRDRGDRDKNDRAGGEREGNDRAGGERERNERAGGERERNDRAGGERERNDRAPRNDRVVDRDRVDRDRGDRDRGDRDRGDRDRGDRDRSDRHDRDRHDRDNKRDRSLSIEKEVVEDEKKKNIPKRTPISLEEMMEKRKNEEQKLNHVVFLTKKQREDLMKEKKKQEELEHKKKIDEGNKARKEFIMQEELTRERERRKRQKEKELERQKREAERQAREKLKEESIKSEKKEESDQILESSLQDLELLNLPEKEIRARQAIKELAQIKNHYLGMKTEKKKMQKPSEKFRTIFNFEWSAEDDTARGDNNPLYQNRVEPQLLFGRGFRAGIDVREQRRSNNFYDTLIKRRGEKQGEEISQKVLKVRYDLEVDIDPNQRHWTDKTTEEMTDRDWRIYREDFQIYIRGGRVPAPARIWAETPLPMELLDAVRKAGYERPTPIQMQAIPIACEMRDLIGIAETGSGKTAAFCLPMLSYIQRLPPLDDETAQDGPYAIILAPSRELALQIEDETKKFGSCCKVRTVAVVGGRDAESQAFLLRQGCEVVIGTPGRLKDSLEKAYTVLNQCNYVVLDEADRMVDMGFEDYLKFILDAIPSTNLKATDEEEAFRQELEAKAGHRQYRITQMFSATMPAAVERLTRQYLRAPAYISIGDPGGGKTSIEQRVEFIFENQKKQRLQEILQESDPPVIVFVNQKKAADVLGKSLSAAMPGLGRIVVLHGGKSQDQREIAIDAFKKGEANVLVATDVAGRGIDVEGVTLVLNFDMPKEIEAYTHRIGRTGRAGKKGLAISFITNDDEPIFYDLKNFLTSNNQLVPHELHNHPSSKIKPQPTTNKPKN